MNVQNFRYIANHVKVYFYFAETSKKIIDYTEKIYSWKITE